MKILFDHQIFYQVIGGASKYFAMMIDSLPKGAWSTSTLLSCNTYVRSLKLFRAFPYIVKGQPRILDFINKPYTNYLLRKGDFDVFHQTNFGTYCLKNLGTKPMVTTFHDTNFFDLDPHPEIIKQQRESLGRADAIICVSHNTKSDLLNHFNIDSNKVHVVYHGIDIVDRESLPQTRIVKRDYVLFVGRRHNHKNFHRFAKAFSILSERHPDLDLVCTGDPFTSEEQEYISSLHIENSVIHIAANEEEMHMLYRDAVFFAYPSLYEGFGMPILEAWSCRCPVLLSNTSCFPEIADNAGLYFDPTSVDDMADKMEKALSDESLRKCLVKRGYQRVKLFSWRHCAEEHMKIYQSLL